MTTTSRGRADGWNGVMPLPRPFRRRAARTAAVPVALPPVLRTPRAAAWWISLAVLLVGGAVGGTLWWLLTDLAVQAPTAPAGQPAGVSGSALEAVLRTGLAAGAGVGAGITLALRYHLECRSAALVRCRSI
ncbi:hypothetical protein GT755_00150 [Herbidospora sp. NEAU-GS84]|uniref:Uncharacterized protein n=1 Tax=Herbidospora solisilvae TaxID=2696284 RepID=A0A7C9NEB7_9ACTN|nr:hypothetical protein [Herbidospora solisilvae]NAS20092.1 hypothetical protein [Herbidospora solisilvae]